MVIIKSETIFSDKWPLSSKNLNGVDTLECSRVSQCCLLCIHREEGQVNIVWKMERTSNQGKKEWKFRKQHTAKFLLQLLAWHPLGCDFISVHPLIPVTLRTFTCLPFNLTDFYLSNPARQQRVPMQFCLTLTTRMCYGTKLNSWLTYCFVQILYLYVL